MFNFIINFIKATFGAVAMFVVFLVMCLFGYFIYWFVEFMFVGAVESEWITNEYVVTVIQWIFEGQYSDIIEIILVVGFGVMWVFGKADD